MRPRVRFLAAAAACLLAAAAPLSAAAPSPAVTATSTGSVNVSWTGGTAPFIAVISTSPSFSVTTASGSVTASTTGYPALDPDTTYYFKVKSNGDPEALYSSALSTATRAEAPSGIYSLPHYFTSDSSFTAVTSIGWDTGANPEWTIYDLAYHTDGPEPETIYPVNNPQGSPISVGGLNANTTYYFKVRTRGVSGVATAYTPSISTATLALALPSITEDVFETSATIAWSRINDGSIAALASEGYRLDFSASIPLTSPQTWTTADPDASSTTITALSPNTVYYYKAGAVNWAGAPNMSGIRSFTTLAPAPGNLTRLAVDDGSATLGWAALGTGEALGYRLEASTDAFAGGGVIQSSASYATALSTLTINTLDPNTTYYFRAATLNDDNAPNYSSLLSSVTLALPISADPQLTFANAGPQAITVNFIPLQQAPQAFACEGYRLEGSTAAFGSGGTLFSSTTYAYQDGLRPLTLSNLAPNTTYYLRLATLNWERTPNYSVLPSTKTGFPGPLTGATLDNVWSSTASVSFTPGTAAEGYVAQASVHRFFNTIDASSSTPGGSASNLIISGLAPNTPYYFRAGALYNGTTIYTNTVPEYEQSLPAPLTGLAFPDVFRSSVTVSWTPLAGASQATSAESYLLQADTDPAFSSPAFSSTTLNIGLDRLAITGLSPNTSYYFRTGTVNLEGSVNYTFTPATSTLANPPVEQAFAITPYSMNLHWLANSNPSDTRYLVELDDDPGFSPVAASSVTMLSSATFSSGLLPNTTYYTRVTAINRLNRSIPPVVFSAMATGAYDPGTAAASGIGVSSLTANWASGAGPGFYNGAGTYYSVAISSSQDFSGAVLSSTTLGLSSSFYGLVSNASYYMRVSALNLTSVPTDPPVQLETVLTLPATAYTLPSAQAFTDMLTDGFSLNWEPNGNSSHTLYYVQASTRSDFGVINSSRLVQGLTCAFSDLRINATYWLRIQARGQTGIQSAYVAAGSTGTLISSGMNALALQDTVITLETSYGQISVHIPNGAIGGSTRLTLSPSTTTLPSPSSAVSALTPTGIGLTLTHSPPTLVLGAITITLPYRVGDLPPGIDRSRLVLAFYDEASAVWVPLPSVSDLPANRVIGQTWHLSTFQIMQSNAESGLGGAKIYPDPYRPNSVTDVMHFANIPAFARVKIYTFLGELVRSLKADINGMTYWDGLNDSGNKAASGVYIAFIQTHDKKNGKSFKIALER